MKYRLFSNTIYLTVLLILSACSPAKSETGTSDTGPTVEFTTAVPSTEESTPTTQIIEEPKATAEIPEPTPTEVPGAINIPGETTALCPDFPDPAMILFMVKDYALFDPTSGETCPLKFNDNVISCMVAAAQNEFFVNIRTTGPEGDATIIQRISRDGIIEDLPYTLIDTQHGTTMVSFVVSKDANQIAWSVVGPAANGDFTSSSISINNLETGQAMGGTVSDIREPRALQPIRFSDDGSTLLYALQPYVIGGSWIAFVGRYDNLYAIPTDGSSAPELIFDCADTGTGLCIGDFILYENSVNGLAYVDRETKSVIILNGDGTILNTLTTDEEYDLEPCRRICILYR